ncbi:MAG: hypothetical protein HYU97_02600 [Deltaproteobacteria bacterium]|nr:hypothetical protein [Deltaproteobacteria bacterium]
MVLPPIRPTSPVDLHINEATISIAADLKGNISCNDWKYNSVDFEFNNAKLFGDLSIRNNFFFLGRKLLQTRGVEVNGIVVDVSDPALTYWYPPHRDSQGDLIEYGELWLSSTPDRFFAASNWLFNDGPVGKSLNHYLPDALKEDNGSLPSALRVNDLLGVLFSSEQKTDSGPSDFPYVTTCYSEAKGNNGPLNILEDIFKNAKITINVREMTRLVIPNGIAFGASSFDATVTFPDQDLRFPKLDVSNFEIEVMPWVFKTSPKTGMSEWAFLGGKIWADARQSEIVDHEREEALTFLSGLHVTRLSLRTHINGVFHFSLDFLLPFVGKVTVLGSLLVNTELPLFDGKINFQKGTTYLRFKDIEVIETESGEPLLDHFNITLTDIPGFKPSFFTNDGFTLSLQASSGAEGGWEFESHTEIPLNVRHLLQEFPNIMDLFDRWGAQGQHWVYELPNSIGHLITHTQFDFRSDKQHTHGSIDTSPASMWWVGEGTQIDFEYSQKSSDKKLLSMLGGARLLLGMARGEKDIFSLQFSADRFGWRDLLDLHQSKISIAFDRAQIDEDTFKFSLKDFQILANNESEQPACVSKTGKIRGPIHIKLSSISEDPLEIQWRPNQRHVAFSGADFAFSLQGLHDPLLAKTSRGLVHYFALDGRFTGNMEDLSYDPNHFVGLGRLSLVGNQDGPYLVDPETRRYRKPRFLKDAAGGFVSNPYPLRTHFNPLPGDMQLLDSACQMVGPPYFAWTHWAANAIGEQWVQLTLDQKGRSTKKWLPHRDVYVWVDGSYRPRRKYARWVKEPLPQKWETALPKMKGDDPTHQEIFKGYAWGDYHLEVDVDQRTLRPFGMIVPLLFTFRLPSNNVYFLPRGVGAIEQDFLDEQERHPYSKLLWFLQQREEGDNP